MITRKVFTIFAADDTVDLKMMKKKLNCYLHVRSK